MDYNLENEIIEAVEKDVEKFDYCSIKQAALSVFYNDITEVKLIDKAKEYAEERFAKAFESSPIPLSISKLSDERIVDVNKSFLELFEFTRREVIGSTPILLKMFGTSYVKKNKLIIASN